MSVPTPGSPGPILRSISMLALLLALAPRPAGASCGAENCPLDNSLYDGRPRRMSFELSYQYVDQDRLRAGTERLDLSALPSIDREVRTVSRLLTAKAIASFGSRWTVSALLPYVDRMHQHISAEDLPEPELRTWNYTGFGDMMVHGVFTAVGADRSSHFTLGVQAGLKLPTGRRHVEAIAGEEPEPHARPGTGSADLLVGFQAVERLSLPWIDRNGEETALFVSTMYTHTTYGTDDHRVGRSVEGQVGASHPLMDRLRLMTQFNFRSRGKDEHAVTAAGDGEHNHPAPESVVVPTVIEHISTTPGALENTGGTSVFASPGLRYQVSPLLTFSAYAQFPIYQRVNGVQITAPSQFWFGVTTRLP